MFNINLKKIALYLPVFVFSAYTHGQLNLADEPLSAQAVTAKSNVMLIMDDSGSMGGDDVFYTPGYDFNADYSCSTATTLSSDPSKIVTAKILKSNNMGYFIYGESSILGQDYYVQDTASADIDLSGTASLGGDYFTCSHPSPNQELDWCRVGSFSSPLGCSGGWGDGYSDKVAEFGFVGITMPGGSLSTCEDNITQVSAADYPGLTADDCVGRGNYDNDTLCGPSAGTVKHGPWKSSWVYKFKTSLEFERITVPPSAGDVITNVCFDPNQEYRVKLKASDCTDSTFCTAASDSERSYDGNFLNWYFSASSKDWFSFAKIFWDKMYQVWGKDHFFPTLTVREDWRHWGPQRMLYYHGCTPDVYAKALEMAKEEVLKRDARKFVTVGIWNEVYEDGYLQPDVKYGYEYGKRIKAAFSE